MKDSVDMETGLTHLHSLRQAHSLEDLAEGELF